MKALFVGGVTDNSELDLEDGAPPPHYPEAKGTGVHRYRLHSTGGDGQGAPLYAVYAPPEMDDAEVERIVAERRYAQRFARH